MTAKNNKGNKLKVHSQQQVQTFSNWTKRITFSKKRTFRNTSDSNLRPRHNRYRAKPLCHTRIHSTNKFYCYIKSCLRRHQVLFDQRGWHDQRVSLVSRITRHMTCVACAWRVTRETWDVLTCWRADVWCVMCDVWQVEHVLSAETNKLSARD